MFHPKACVRASNGADSVEPLGRTELANRAKGAAERGKYMLKAAFVKGFAGLQ